ncbi:MAG: hypothetical protein ABIK09_10925 [Pseudomonadota bacterium]
MRISLVTLLLIVLSVPAPAGARELCGHQLLNALTPWDVPPWTGPVEAGRGFPEIGDQRDFWIYDLSVMPPMNEAVPATCRGVSARSAIWVGDADWGTKVDQQAVDNMLAALEEATPRTPDAGIIQGNTSLFGASPHFAANDPDLSVLVYTLEGYKGSLFDGYFRAEDLTPFNPACQNNPMLYCSNELGMIHLNANNPGSDYMIGVVAHEFEHMIHFARDPYEEVWVNEAMAELAMIFHGYQDPGNLAFYTDNPDAPLVVQDFVDYGAVLLFGAYLEERLGPEGITALVADTLTGLSGVKAHLPAGVSWERLFGQWVAANVLDAPAAANGEYGYTLVDVPEFATEELGAVPMDLQATIPPSAGGYFTLDATGVPFDESLTVTFDPLGSGAVAHAVLPGTVRVLLLPPGEEVVLPIDMADPDLRFTVSNPGNGPAMVRFVVNSVYMPGPDSEPEPGPETAEEDVTVGPGVDTIVPADTLAGEDTGEGGGSGGGGGCSRSGAAAGGPLALLLGLLVAAFFLRERRRGER